MPRARLPSASLVAGADALLLPWLAPRVFVESPVLNRRQRRHGKSTTTQKKPDAIAGVDGTSRCLPARTTSTSPRANHAPSTGASCRTSARTRPRSLDLRYVDIASFARRHARHYATTAATTAATSSPPADTTPVKTPPLGAAANQSTRYSGRRSWTRQLDELDQDLSLLDHGQVRAKLIAQASKRMAVYARRLQRHTGCTHDEELLHHGQYRSLRRLILSLKQWDTDVEHVRGSAPMHADEQLWWLQTFAALDRSVYPRLCVLTKPVTLHHAPECRQHALQLLDGVRPDDTSRLFANWHEHKELQKLYQGTLIYMLDHHPGYAHDFITILATDQQLPPCAPLLADALGYLGRLHLKGEYPAGQGWEESPEDNARNFIATFLKCTPYIDTVAYSQDLLRSVTVLADIQDLKKVYTALVELETHFSLGTMLHFASAFGDAGEFSYALQCLENRLAGLPDRSRLAIVNTQLFHWTCAAILRGSMRTANNYHETPAIVAALVQLGVEMSLLLYGVVIHNAMDAGDFATAFKVFNSLESNGLSADHYTYSILLHGCATQLDPAMFTTFAQLCRTKAKELEDSWLATDFIHYTYACEQNKPVASRSSNTIWRAYLDLFDLTPLQPFVRDGSRAMKDAIDEEGLDAEKQRLTPKPATLYLMLQTEIQTLETIGVTYLERLYKTFKHAISTSRAHPALVSLAQTPIIWNTFLLAFCRHAQYASASTVIKDMDAHGCPPNVYTWNIFMQAFFKTKQVAAADRVFALMGARGVDPDAFTYGIMVRGYAKAQLTARIADTMPHIPDDAQLAPDLLRALSRVQDRADLTARLERSRLAKLRRDAEDKEMKRREEEKRFAVPRFESLFKRALTFREPTHWDHGTVEEADDFLEPDEDGNDEGEALGVADAVETQEQLGAGTGHAHDVKERYAPRSSAPATE